MPSDALITLSLLVLLLLAAVVAGGWWGGVRARAEAAPAARAAALLAARQAAVIQSSPDAVISVDEDHRIVLFNPAAEQLLGVPAAEAIGSDVSRFVPMAVRDRHARWMGEFAAGGATQRTIGVHRPVMAMRRDGHLLPVEASIAVADEPMVDGGRKLLTVVLRDTTERRRAEEDLYRMQERYRAIVYQSPDGIVLVEEGRIVLANPAAVGLLGERTADDLLGQPLSGYLHGWPDQLQPHARPAGADGARTVPMIEDQVHRPDGSVRDVEVWLADVPDHGGRAAQLVLRDISERKRIDRIRRDRQRLLMQIDRIARTVPGVIAEWRLMPDGRHCMPYVSGMFEAQYGLPHDAALRDMAPVFERVHEQDVEGLRAQIAASARDLLPLQHEWRYRHPQRGERWFEGRAVPHRQSDGAVVWHGVVMDVTERKRSEEALRESRANLLEAERIARLGHFNLDLTRHHCTLSDSLAALMGCPERREMDTATVLALVHDDDRGLMQALLDTPSGAAASAIGLDRHFRIVRADDGAVRWMHCLGTLQMAADGRPERVFGTVQDVTESKRAADEVMRSREELRRLSDGLNNAREQERRHISRELHDELGQRLTAVKLEIAALLAAEPANDGPMRERLRGLLASIDFTVASVRRIAADLRPTMLDDLGLPAALEWLAREASQRSGLDVQLDGEPYEGELSDAAATTVYRIVQEGLTNVTRHASATRVRIRLDCAGDDLRVLIDDDGIGLAPGDTAKRSSFGLMGMRERARILGGRASVRNRDEGGCRLEVRLPLDRVGGDAPPSVWPADEGADTSNKRTTA